MKTLVGAIAAAVLLGIGCAHEQVKTTQTGMTAPPQASIGGAGTAGDGLSCAVIDSHASSITRSEPVKSGSVDAAVVDQAPESPAFGSSSSQAGISEDTSIGSSSDQVGASEDSGIGGSSSQAGLSEDTGIGGAPSQVDTSQNATQSGSVSRPDNFEDTGMGGAGGGGG
jgi:hypothetical protein